MKGMGIARVLHSASVRASKSETYSKHSMLPTKTTCCPASSRGGSPVAMQPSHGFHSASVSLVVHLAFGKAPTMVGHCDFCTPYSSIIFSVMAGFLFIIIVYATSPTDRKSTRL